MFKRFSNRISIAGLIIFWSVTVLSQPITPSNTDSHQLGVLRGVGTQNFLNLNYDYRVSFYNIQYSYIFNSHKKNKFSIVVEPQYNMVKLNVLKDEIYEEVQSYEFGVNIGLMYKVNLIPENLYAYILGSTGPHYVSITPQRQAPGFIFSDNIALGTQIMLLEQLSLDMRIGIRHISNAGLKKPNGGVNNLIMFTGIVYTIGRKW